VDLDIVTGGQHRCAVREPERKGFCFLRSNFVFSSDRNRVRNRNSQQPLEGRNTGLSLAGKVEIF